MTDWFRESLHATVTQSFARTNTVYAGDTDFQRIEIFDNEVLGRVMALDGIVQTTERDEFIYHEMLVHVPAFAHGEMRNVLIVGGGDGGALREVLRHPIERATVVDIDGQVIELSKKFMPGLSAGGFEDPRTNVIVGDGVKFVHETEERFDVVIIDSTDPVGPGEGLFTRAFYQRCAAILAPRGVVITQNGVPFLQSDELQRTSQRFSGVFRHFGFYVIAVPTYYGGFMALGWGSNELDISCSLTPEVLKRIDTAKLQTRYYNNAIHHGAFALPQYIRELVDAEAVARS